MEQHTDDTASDAVSCPSCGGLATLGTDGAFVECTTCGLVPVAEKPTGSAAAEEPLREDAVRCQWCGAANPPELERCRKCNAAFPNPEMDLAMLKAAEERLRVMEDEISLRSHQRKSWLLGKLFG